MPASLITWDDKSNNRTLSGVDADKKMSAADVNEVKTAVNTNASLTDTNTSGVSANASAIATNTAAITPGTSSSTAIDLTSRAGTTHSDVGSFMSNTSFTLAASPVENGFAFILSNAASVPTITGATAHSNFATDYQTGSDNIILVTYINGLARYQLAFV